MTKSKTDNGEAGFTLIELLVVLVIIGLISAFVVPRVIGYVGRAKTDAASIQVQRLAGILDLYRLDVGRYPSSDEGLQALAERPVQSTRWRGPYVDRAEALTDPWGRPFIYRVRDQGGGFDLITLGADGATGGEGEDLDVEY